MGNKEGGVKVVIGLDPSYAAEKRTNNQKRHMCKQTAKSINSFLDQIIPHPVHLNYCLTYSHFKLEVMLCCFSSIPGAHSLFLLSPIFNNHLHQSQDWVESCEVTRQSFS